MIFINPGTEPVNNATKENARKNIQQFAVDLNMPGIKIRRRKKADYGDGRFAFVLTNSLYKVEIQMPGLPLEKVRYINSETQNIWHFPRLYVDDSSWVWLFALSCARALLNGDIEK